MATLFLAEAGAEVIKVERPGRGEEMRSYLPKWGADSANFNLLNRGKKSIAVDLKDPEQLALLLPLVETADVIVEQFRPGVMQRLGLGYQDVVAINSEIHCLVHRSRNCNEVFADIFFCAALQKPLAGLMRIAQGFFSGE